MAEGWTRALCGDAVDAYSAGIEKHGMNTRAVTVMGESNVDIGRQKSKTVEELNDVDFDVVFTVCGHADESCPSFSGATQVVHVPFDDPPRLAKEAVTEDEALVHFRRVRDEIRDFVESLPQHLGKIAEQPSS